MSGQLFGLAEACRYTGPIDRLQTLPVESGVSRVPEREMTCQIVQGTCERSDMCSVLSSVTLLCRSLASLSYVGQLGQAFCGPSVHFFGSES